ncbi:MAG: hypothetical protein JXR10_14985 [Cyclobacteriaceae bacterium]
MKKLLLSFILLVAFNYLVIGQDNVKAEAYKANNVNYFIKSVPEAKYEIVGEQKVTGVGKTTSYTAGLHGAAGYNQVQQGIAEFNDKQLKLAKKGKDVKYDGILVDKPKLVQFIKLENGAKGAGYGAVGATAISTIEAKSGKIVFFMSKPNQDFTVVTDITYNQGGLGETMRGGNKMDVAINGLIDKGRRWVKKGKISSDFDALLIDYSSIVMGQVKGQLIKFD